MTLFSRLADPFRRVGPSPELLNGLETLERAVKGNLSIARFGDGEMSFVFPGIVSRDLPFQKRDAALSQQLRAIFERDDPRVLTCYNNHYMQREEISIVLDFERSKKRYSSYRSIHRLNDVGVLTGRAKLYRRWNRQLRARYSVKTLGEAMCFFLSIYDEAYQRGTIGMVLDAYRRLFEGRRVLIVAPERPLHGVSFLELVKRKVIVSPSDVAFVEIPDRECFSHRRQILSSILAAREPDVVMLQAGPTATVLAFELATRHGITTYDVGSLNTSLDRAHAVLGATF